MMAIIQISKETNWSTNRWIYNNLLESILSKLSNNDSLYKKLESSLYDGSFFIDFSSYSNEEKCMFSNLVSNVLDKLKDDDSKSFQSLEFYEAFIEKLNELKKLLNTG